MINTNIAQFVVQKEMGQIVYFDCCDKVWFRFQNSTFIFTIPQLNNIRKQLSHFLKKKNIPLQIERGIALTSQQGSKTVVLEMCRDCLIVFFEMLDLSCEILNLQLMLKENASFLN